MRRAVAAAVLGSPDEAGLCNRFVGWALLPARPPDGAGLCNRFAGWRRRRCACTTARLRAPQAR